MRMFPTKVLLAVDGSEEALRAARAGVELAGKMNSELHVVYVAAFPSILYVPEDQERAWVMLAEREGRPTLDEQLEKVEELGGELAGSHLEIGLPDREIVKLGEEIGAGLLVVGSQGI